MRTGCVIATLVIILTASQAFSLESHKWDYFVFSQWWPQSQCYYRNGQTMDDKWRFTSGNARNDCVPADVTTWTLHGLWPTVGGKAEPVNCNSSWPFVESEIQDLEDRMMQRWLAFPDSSKSSARDLWSHEWKKHGTCATDLAQTSNEHSYFSMALALNSNCGLLRALASENIIPSDDQMYTVKQVERAISNKYGAKGRVICLRGPDDQQLLAGIRICLDKSFRPRNCIQTYPEHCSDDDDLGYPTIIRH
ncbi:predicted protein [Nematostella vectensis]|uniref:Uncharacterized protein n=1 Tax=Nematostella vectensis TaxID=45351 RepID=A7RJ98_NEMVE|nr:predicted protein [Nematostella vectensis]|eukprot:XP_001640606.1 predicted protein [Nematostella vectensis]